MEAHVARSVRLKTLSHSGPGIGLLLSVHNSVGCDERVRNAAASETLRLGLAAKSASSPETLTRSPGCATSEATPRCASGWHLASLRRGHERSLRGQTLVRVARTTTTTPHHSVLSVGSSKDHAVRGHTAQHGLLEVGDHHTPAWPSAIETAGSAQSSRTELRASARWG